MMYFNSSRTLRESPRSASPQSFLALKNSVRLSTLARVLSVIAIASFVVAGSAHGQTVASDTQYSISTTGSFSTSFSPLLSATGDPNGELNFGGTTYTVTDDEAAASINDLTGTSSGLVTIAPGTATNVLTLTNNNAGATPTISVGSGGMTISTILGGTSGFIKSGAGTLTLASSVSTNVNTLTGTVIVNAGTLSVTGSQSTTLGFLLNNGVTLNLSTVLPGGGNVINANSGTVTIGGAGASSATEGAVIVGNANITWNATFGTSPNPSMFSGYGGLVSWGTNGTVFRLVQSTTGGSSVSPFAQFDFGTSTGGVNFRNGTSNLILGSIAGGVNTILGASGSTGGGNGQYIVGSANTSTTFNGKILTSANSRDGLVKVGTGTLTLTGVSTTDQAYNANGGTLLLNFNTNTNNIINSGNAFNFSGGALSLLGSGTGSTTQTLGAVALNAGGGALVVNSNGGVSTTLTLGAITATALGGDLNISTSGAAAIITTTTGTDSTGIYGGRITFGTDWATTTSSVTPFTLSAYSGYTALNTAGATDTNNSLATGSVLLAASGTTNSLKIVTTGAGQTLDLGTNTLGLTNGGLLFAGANNYTLTDGTLKSLIATTSDLIIHQLGAGTLTIGATIANGNGNSALTKSGSGTVVLTAANTYTGATFLNAGVLSISSNGNLGTETTGAALNMNGGTLQATSTFGLFNGAAGTNNRAVTIGGGGGTFDVTAGNNLTISGTVSTLSANQFGPLIKTDTGTLTMLSANTYGGATFISGGVLSTNLLANGGVASGIGSSANVANALILDSGTLQYTGAGASTNRTFTVTQNGGAIDASGAGALIFSNTAPVVYSGNGARTLTLTGSTGASNTFAGAIGDGTGGSTSLLKTGSSSWTLTNNNTYTGNTTIVNAGSTLVLSAPNSVNNIASSQVITVGTANVTTATLNVTGLSGGAITLASGQTLAGTGIVNGAVISGSGTTLSPGFHIGNSSTNVGTLTVGGLTLNAGSTSIFEFNTTPANDIIAVNGNLSIFGGGIDIFQAGSQTRFTTPNTYTLFTYTGSLSGSAGALSVLNPSATQTYQFLSTGTSITLTISGAATITATWNVDANGNYGTAGNWNPATVPDGAGTTAIFGSIITAPRVVNIEATHTVGEIDFSPNSGTSYTLSGVGTLILNNSGSPAVIKDLNASNTISAPMSMVAGLNTTVTNSTDVLTFSGALSGTGPLTKDGAGILALTGPNSYFGGTTISNGTVRINSASSLGDVSGTANLSGAANTPTLEALNSITTSRNFTVAGANPVIQVDGTSSTYEIDGLISDGASSGSLTKTGAGTLTLTNNDTYSGSTTISAGVLQLGAGGTSGSVAGNIVNNASLVLNRTDAYTLGNLVSGTGGLIQAGSGAVSLSASNTFSGSTVLTSGTLITANSAALQNSTLNYNNQGGVLSFGSLTAATLGGLTGSQNLPLLNTSGSAVSLTVGNNGLGSTYSGGFSGAGALTKVGAGTFILTGSSSYAGGTSVNGGILRIDAGGSVSTAGVSTAASGAAQLLVNGGLLTASAGATFNANGSGFDLLSGTATFAGVTAASSGGDGEVIRVDGGSFSSTSYTIQRNQSYTTVPTTAAAVAISGFYSTSGSSSLGSLNIGTSNSSASVRIDGGNVTASSVAIGNTTNGGRWNVLDVNGGTFTSTDGTNGIVMSPNAATPNLSELLITGGTVFTPQVTMGLVTSSSGSGLITVTGGALYLGSGGITQLAPVFTSTINLSSGTVGATAPWSSSLGMTSTNATFQAADNLGNANNITLTGGIGGVGLTKTGAGTLFLASAGNFYFGVTTVNAGILNINSEFALGGAFYGGLTLNGGTLQYSNTLLNAVTDVSGTTVTIGPNGGTVDTGTNNINFANSIGNAGTGAFTKAGTGTLTLAGLANNYTGPTNVAAGILVVSGSITATSATSVAAGATLGGKGGIASTLSVSGTVAPGIAASGTATTLSLGNNVTFNNGSAFVVNIDNNGAVSDKLSITGNLAIVGNDTLTLNLLNTTPTTNVFTIASFNPGGLTGTFATSGLPPGYQVLYNNGAGLIQLAPIPEPGTWAMLVSGAGLLVAFRRFRRRH